MHILKHIGVVFIVIGVGIVLGSTVFWIQQRAQPILAHVVTPAPTASVTTTAIQATPSSTNSILLNQSSPTNNP
jgi:hypothetical protein